MWVATFGLGCSEPTPSEVATTSATTGDTATTIPPASTLAEVPLSDLPGLVLPEAGYSLDTVASFGDISGDGVSDAVVGVFDEQGVWMLHVVLGPLRDRLVPRDTWLVVDPGLWILRIVPDHSGDGADDLWVRSSPSSPYGRMTWVLPAPWDGGLLPSDSWTLLDDQGGSVSFTYDVDRDGTFDRVASVLDGAGDRLEITYGPTDRWTGPPDVAVAPMCRGTSGAYPLWSASLPAVRNFPGDLDGDGVPEVSISQYEWEDFDVGCGEFTVSLPGGEVDPYDTAATGRYLGLVTEAVTVGDLTGDGAPELWEPTFRVLWTSPISLTTTEVSPAAQIVADRRILHVLPTGRDLDADGRPESFAEVERDEGEPLWVLLPGEPDGWAQIPDGAPGYAVDYPGPFVDHGDGGVDLVLWDASTNEWRRAPMGAP